MDEGLIYMKKILNYFSLFEYLLYFGSLLLILTSFFVFENTEYSYLVGSIIGITALIFLAKGNPIGQALTIVFSIFYGFISYSFSYYGEMFTYLLMTLPVAVISLIEWLKNPFKGNIAEVEIVSLKKKDYVKIILLGITVSIVFYFVLKWFNTPNLLVSTFSVLTSFIASFLAFKRNRFYAVAYAFNDIVLIILWVLATITDINYMPIIFCFAAFLLSDLYGFVSWTKIEKKQNNLG